MGIKYLLCQLLKLDDADDTMKEVTDQLESTQINDDNHGVDDGNKEQNDDANQIGNSDEDQQIHCCYQ